MRTPKANLPPLWHLLGISAMVLFAMRFWVQWWLSERHQKSELPKSFWYMSLLGGSFSLFYFCHARDLVNIIGYGMGLIPYVRNLMLSKNELPLPPKGNYFVFAGEQSGDHLGHDSSAELETACAEAPRFRCGRPADAPLDE